MRAARPTPSGWLVIAMAFLAAPAQASYIISFQQVGPNVVATGSGSIDTHDLTFVRNAPTSTYFNPVEMQCYLGLNPTGNSTEYTSPTVTGPSTFGSTNANHFASSSSGAVVGIELSVHAITVPSTYVSGTDLGTSTDTFSNQSFSTDGLTPGTYKYTWGTAPDADSLTIQVGTPEPASLSLLAVGSILSMRRRRMTR